MKFIHIFGVRGARIVVRLLAFMVLAACLATSAGLGYSSLSTQTAGQAQPPGVIGENTFITLGLFLSLCGAVWWVAGKFKGLEKDIEAVQKEQKRMNDEAKELRAATELRCVQTHAEINSRLRAIENNESD